MWGNPRELREPHRAVDIKRHQICRPPALYDPKILWLSIFIWLDTAIWLNVRNSFSWYPKNTFLHLKKNYHSLLPNCSHQDWVSLTRPAVSISLLLCQWHLSIGAPSSLLSVTRLPIKSKFVGSLIQKLHIDLIKTFWVRTTIIMGLIIAICAAGVDT